MPTLSLDVPEELIKDPNSWTVEDIGLWLQWLGIGEHSEVFASRGIDGRALLRLNAGVAWADLGVVDPAQQRVLDSAVEPLRSFRDSDGAESGIALHAVEGPLAGEVIYVGAGGITGGRHSVSNGIVLSENYVSRRHFQITRDRAAQYMLQDVGSTTGTFLMVREELPLEHLMVLQLGTTELTIYMEDPARCTLVATEGPDKDARATVTLHGLFIGREPSNTLCIRDPQISAFHCEIRRDAEGTFILDDRYSTNRTWLRLAPDGQPSRRFVLQIGDLFKVGSSLFHVIEPASAAAAPETTLEEALPAGTNASVVRPNLTDGALEESEPDRGADDRGVEDSIDGEAGDGEVDEQTGQPELRWEPFVEGETRPMLSPEEYARRVTASRRHMHAQAAARRSSPGWRAEQSQASIVQQRELSSLQQGMRNSRAQTAYTLQQQRPQERRDEDLCKICYDNDIGVVLYPCGHFILCRWCAFKVSDCPVCRVVITHVIRTYKA